MADRSVPRGKYYWWDGACNKRAQSHAWTARPSSDPKCRPSLWEKVSFFSVRPYTPPFNTTVRWCCIDPLNPPRLSGLSEHPRQGTIVLTSLFQIISRPFLGSARTLAHRFLAAFAIFALPASERTRFSCTQFGCDPECQGQGRGAAAMSAFIILNQEQSAQRPSVPFAYFTSTFVRIQGWMQHWKRCSPFESPVS